MYKLIVYTSTTCWIVSTLTSTANHHNPLCFPLGANLSAHPEARGSRVSTPFTQTKAKTKTSLYAHLKVRGSCISTPFTHPCPLAATRVQKHLFFPPVGLSDQFGKQRIIQLTRRANGSKNISFWPHDSSAGIQIRPIFDHFDFLGGSQTPSFSAAEQGSLIANDNGCISPCHTPTRASLARWVGIPDCTEIHVTYISV